MKTEILIQLTLSRGLKECPKERKSEEVAKLPPVCISSWARLILFGCLGSKAMRAVLHLLLSFMVLALMWVFTRIYINRYMRREQPLGKYSPAKAVWVFCLFFWVLPPPTPQYIFSGGIWEEKFLEGVLGFQFPMEPIL